jgi:hypothetical protein
LETWAELICLHFNLINSNTFTGNDLMKVFQSKYKCHSTSQMDEECCSAPKDHIRIFSDWLHYPKRSSFMPVKKVNT